VQMDRSVGARLSPPDPCILSAAAAQSHPSAIADDAVLMIAGAALSDVLPGASRAGARLDGAIADPHVFQDNYPIFPGFSCR
ncbi:MAG: hypothetical protein ACREH9_13430, partial [Pseudomonadota bacterium]